MSPARDRRITRVSNRMRPRAVAIVPAAGLGKRLCRGTSKPFVLIGGRPIISRTLQRLESSDHIDAIILACERSSMLKMERLVKRCRFKKVSAIVAGGATRFESVRNCLKLVGDEFEIVLIHDGARPFVDGGLISASIRKAVAADSAIAAVPENDTVKLAGGDLVIKKTIERRRLWRAQTPQVFKSSVIKKAYARSNGRGVTDDASLVESMGLKVSIVPGSYRNIKITTEEDLRIAEALI